ncbi:hypothetical protein EXIGLDRAFT_610914 [Exidia glandulosa HHB12029]|uniref:Uncharacterized protein n=1 Tax=Exidia glandulosa HHB12029 TaxID=1314781 RepID=A0A165JNS7_EXIGL|nr:hypothetical protein EXIGLDRAFT_610914 [Exidia glandulosa HHB12029]
MSPTPPPPSVTQEALAPVAEADASPITEEKVASEPVPVPVAVVEQPKRPRKKSIKKKPPKKDNKKAKAKEASDPAATVPPPAADTVAVITVQNGDAADVPSAPASTLPPTTSSATVAEAPPAPHQKKHLVKKSEKKADAAAIGVRTLIVGPVSDPASPKANKPLTKSEVNKLKGQLLEPKSAMKIIARLRNLPVPPPNAHGQSPEAAVAQAVLSHDHATPSAQGPIHAVCLDCTDAEAEALHFSQLQTTTQAFALADASSAFPVLRNMRIVSLINTPDFGFGKPIGSSGAGILSGSVPSVGVIADGLMQLSQQLVALGFATGNAVHPSHVGMYPPIDRTSVITYWWGLEVLLPEASMQFLSNVKSVQNAVLNVLTALSMFNQGVREILPFIRYISQFIDFEWNAIQAQDRGQGVVCAATWVMPAAMVPRPWDFPAPPEGETVPTDKGTQFEFVPPPGPVLPELPMLKVTPATLPRSADAPELLEAPTVDAEAPVVTLAHPSAPPAQTAIAVIA